jgi:very-short-patch-repair endonuclease/DNA polymerase III delta prime subunit
MPGCDRPKLSFGSAEGSALAATPEERTLEDVALPTEVEGYTKRRVELVQKAAKEWTAALVDLGGRNNLLRYRDLKQGTLDLTEASSQAVRSLLQGRTIKVSALFSDPEERERSLRRVRTIHNKAKENFEERGLETLSIACGLATWENKRAVWEPCAPVLLRQATLRPLGAAQDEFELALVDEMEVNPTLLHLLKVDFDCDFDHEKLLDRVDGVIDEQWELLETYTWMEEHARRVPGFHVEPRTVLANFAYAKLPMVKDIENAFDELVAHELIAAIAGEEECREAIRSQGPGPDAIPSPNQTPLADEFLVLDADSSQNYAINSVLAGQSLIVKGPPGTGKSQTIANLIASLTARDKKVLFVAEKRAAIDAVTKRLNQKKLGDLVLDLHGGVSSRRAFAQAIGQALVASRAAPRIDNDAELKKVEKRRAELNGYVEAMHETRQPWDLSVYEIRAQLLGLELAKNEIRFRREAIDTLGAEEARKVEEDLAEYARLGGLTLATSGSPWAKSPVVSAEEVQQAHASLDELRRHTFPKVESALERSSDETALPKAERLADWQSHIDLWGDIAQTLSNFAPEIYERDLEVSCERFAAASRGGLSRMKAGLFSGDYKACRDELRAARTGDGKLSDHELYGRTESARDDVRSWRQLGGTDLPRAPVAVAELEGPYKQLLEQLERLEGWIGRTGLTQMPISDVQALLDELLADRATLVKLPDLRGLETSLLAAGLGEFLAEMRARQVSEEFAVQSFRYAWLQSILDHLSLADVMVGGFVPEKHEKAIAEFRKGDRDHIETTPLRIRRICAESAVKARDTFKEQAALVQHQAGLKRRHLPVRDLVRNAADVLLALKPCWAMSPLVVSQLLPPKTYFDVVIFDEASQITPADAVSSILRGKQLVVAGDEKQLPPTAFFVSEASEDEEEDERSELEIVPLVAGTKGFESILDALASLLRFRMLLWHYRSRDERLIAFSNAHIYDRMLTTFPGVGGTQVLSYVPVPWEPGADTNSPTPEVNAVVDLILGHARERPDESLGVIAMGIRHANRIEECLRQRLSEDPELAEELGEFFDESHEERFFVKNLERVQGDERDAIILSIGYGKDERGDLPYRFGPLLMEGGERRLNVAVTRAKGRITLVSSFSYRDMDPERSSAEGVKLLRQYLQYVESGGTNLGDRVLEKPALNPFEMDVRDTLSRRGLKLTAQYGSSGYWIDFAVQHPTEPGRYVLALECDGATYHSSESARDRDRLRQEQLERLGWKFCRIWSSEWFYNKDASVQNVLDAYENAVREADRKPEPELSVAEPRSQPDLPSSRRGTRPPIRRGLPIDAYTPTRLVQLVRWIESDDQLRTEDELLRDAMNELGFQRHGKKIAAALRAAIRQARA